MNLGEQLQEQEQIKKRQQEQRANSHPEDDEGILEYAQRPAFVAVDAQESVFDRGSLNRQHGINTQPSVFHSTWGQNTE